MPEQLYVLRGVPEDEADEIRELLDQEGIDYYETPAGNWGISLPAIWLRDKSQLVKAKRLIEEYQKQRTIRVKYKYEQLKRTGKNKTLLDAVLEHPARFVIYLAVCATIIYFSIKPFFDLI